MTKILWDLTGERTYETGADHGVLYEPNNQGAYDTGVAWNGLTSVSENPTGAEATPLYADNIKYLNLISAEEFGATIEAYTFPDEFEKYDGLGVPSPGVAIGQQSRGVFGFSYRTIIGNDVDGNDHGYKLHLVYGAQASPSQKAYNTVNDTPEAITLSWEITTTPVAVTGMKPTATITIDSTKVDATALGVLEDFLYGTAGTDPRLPLPDEVIDIFDGTITEVTPTKPAFDDVDEITIPSVAGVVYYIEGVAQAAGVVTITSDTVVTAGPASGYYFPDPVADEWYYVYGGA